MQELTMVHYWMAGVMFVMAIYAGIALHGYNYSLKRDKQSNGKKPGSS